MNRVFFFIFTCALFLGILPYPAKAYSEHLVTGKNGKPMFLVKIRDEGEKGYVNTSTWTLSNTLKDKVIQGFEYWAEILGPYSKNTLPDEFSITTLNDYNAYGTTAFGTYDGINYSLTQLSFNNNIKISSLFEKMSIGKMDWNNEAVLPSLLPGSEQYTDLRAVTVHEIGHVMGIFSSASSKPDNSFFFDPTIYNIWDTYLFDSNGNPAVAGQTVVLGNGPRPDITDFYIDQSEIETGNVYFKGKQVDDVLNGAELKFINTEIRVPGIPLNGADPVEFDEEGNATWAPELSHIELRNGLMSHQFFRNYTTFMEAELAILQDLGYQLDRRNFYGRSVYGDNLIIENEDGFFARNKAGTAYLPGKYNTSSFGVGLHVYGEGNTITQKADLLSIGMASAGIRIDGANTFLKINPSVRVHANGKYSSGLMVAYGKEHQIIHQGDIEALGDGGVAVRFDFGGNAMGTDRTRGSYINYVLDTALNIPSDIDGELVSAFDVSGRISGNAAAVYIAGNAYVKAINLMNGTEISGDIISHWDPANPHINHPSPADLTTGLTFGLKADSNGQATVHGDENFRLKYTGNILGADSIHMSHNGGILSFNGQADVLSMAVAENAVLKGNAVYNTPLFTNNGSIRPGNSIGTIVINGDFIHDAAADLVMEFNPENNDRLIVSGTALLNGRLTLAPVAGYYANPVTLTLDQMIQSSTLQNHLTSTDFIPVSSPTLTLSMTSNGSGSYTITTSRPENAYSRYAANRNTAAVGSILDRTAFSAVGSIQSLYARLDFSSDEDIRMALPQLTPAAYAAAIDSSLNAGRMISQLMAARMFYPPEESDKEYHFFAMPIGGFTRQDTLPRTTGYDTAKAGIAGGFEKHLSDSFLLGIHFAYLHQQTDTHRLIASRLKTDGFYAGIHSMIQPRKDGFYVFGTARIGAEINDMERRVRFTSYSASAQSKWTGFSGNTFMGTGYDIAVENWTVGPTAGLEYAFLSRPSITEKKGNGSALHLNSETYNSLQSRLGLRAQTAKTVEGGKITANLTTAWTHELLNNTRKLTASFAGYGYDFPYQEDFAKDSVALEAGFSFVKNSGVSYTAQIGTSLFRQGYREFYGTLSCNVPF